MVEHGRGLVGRDGEVAAFDAALDGLADGRARAIELAGEPGIGKSRLLAELGERADARGMLVLSGAASEFERDLAFWLFVDALDDYLRAADPGRLDGLDDEIRDELGHLLPSWPAPAREGPARHDRRYRSHRAVCRVLEVLAGPTPVVLLLDDLHWADSGSAELLCALLRRPPGAPVLIGMAARPRQLSGRLAAGLERAADDGMATRLEPGPLSLPEARQLLGPVVDERRVAALHADTGGNPFYLRLLARSRPGEQGGPGPELDGVPAAVATAIAAELAPLGPFTRRVLEGAAVAGDPFPLELAAAAAGLGEAAVGDELDELLGRDLLRPTDAPRRFRFRHPLLRRAVHDGTPAAWRLGAHERCANALAARGVSPAGRAHHVLAAARPGDGPAIALLRAAGDSVVRRAPGEAARWYRAAIGLLPDDARDEAAGLWTVLAGALGASGRLTEARDALLRALDLTPREAAATRARLVADCAQIEHTLGHHDSAHRRLVAALAGLPDTHGDGAIALTNALAQDDLYRVAYSDARARARPVLRAARALGDPVVLAETLVGSAVAATFDGATAEAAAACADAARLVDDLSDEQIGNSSDPVAVRLAAVELFADRHPDADRHAERGLAVARDLGSDQHVPVLFWAGTVRTALGRLPEAAALLDEAVEVARSAGNASMLGWALLARSTTAVARGDVEVAVTAAEESVAAHAGRAPVLPAVWAALPQASALLLDSAPATAERILLDAAGGETLARLPAPLRPSGLEVLTRCRLAQDRLAPAADAARAAQTCADGLGLRSARATADRAAAAVALHRGEPLRAADRARSAARGADAVGAPVDAAAARELAGRALATAGRAERAAEELYVAAADYDRCGAPRRRAAVERLLRTLGHHRHHRSRPGVPEAGAVASLTGRELEVARLVTDRRTNTEVAAELFLSRKTVETHIRNVFHKLGVSSRADIARAVERFDRDGA